MILGADDLLSSSMAHEALGGWRSGDLHGGNQESQRVLASCRHPTDGWNPRWYRLEGVPNVIELTNNEKKGQIR